MTKPPVFKGRRKGYAEIWLGDGCVTCRIRLRLPDGTWKWSDVEDPGWFKQPCWLDSNFSNGAISKMKAYDRSQGRKTIFLGYFK